MAKPEMSQKENTNIEAIRHEGGKTMNDKTLKRVEADQNACLVNKPQKNPDRLNRSVGNRVRKKDRGMKDGRKKTLLNSRMMKAVVLKITTKWDSYLRDGIHFPAQQH